MEVVVSKSLVQRSRRRKRVREWLRSQEWVTVKYWGKAKAVCFWGLIEAHLDEVSIDDLEIIFDYAPDKDCPHVRIWLDGDCME
jgi:hypothetical protein